MSLDCYGFGRLTRDVEFREVTGGTVVQISLATDRKYSKKGTDGKTDFFDISVYVPTDDKSNQLDRARLLKLGLPVFLFNARVEIDQVGEGKEKRNYTKIRIGSIYDIKYDPSSSKLGSGEVPDDGKNPFK